MAPRAPGQQSSAAGWINTAALIIATLVLCNLDQRLGQLPGNIGPPLCFMPSMLGPCLLTAAQQIVLVAVFFAVWVGSISGQLTPGSPQEVMALLGPIPILIALIALAQLRQNCRWQQAALRDKLERSLQASALAHELGQPLSELLLQTRLVQHRLEQQPGISTGSLEPLEHLQECGQEIQNLIRAITGLLNNQALSRDVVDLAAIARRCLQQRQPARLMHGIGLRSAGLEEPRLVQGDARQLEIAISNLLQNAEQCVNTLSPGRRQLSVVITQTGRQMVLQVADSGPGLPSTEQQDLLMNSNKPNGMGLGLLTVRSIALRHGGDLRLGASSELGGAELSLSLPVAH